MQNAVIILGAVLGLVAGGWCATYLFYESGDLGFGVTAFTGAIPGIFLGGWLAMKAVTRES